MRLFEEFKKQVVSDLSGTDRRRRLIQEASCVADALEYVGAADVRYAFNKLSEVLDYVKCTHEEVIAVMEGIRHWIERLSNIHAVGEPATSVWR